MPILIYPRKFWERGSYTVYAEKKWRREEAEDSKLPSWEELTLIEKDPTFLLEQPEAKNQQQQQRSNQEKHTWIKQTTTF